MDPRVESPDGAPAPLRLEAFDYPLPPELIAQEPAPVRDAARLLVLDRARATLAHAAVCDLPQWLRAGDVLVFNDTRVRPARLFGRTATGGAVELLLVSAVGGGTWHVLGKPAKRLKEGTRLAFPDRVDAVVTARRGGGRYAVAFPEALPMPEYLARHGELPLPPYIRRPAGVVPVDRERYQTVFAANAGAVAAPTAGLHFTPALLDVLRAAGIELVWLTLHVGPGTFLPVRDADVSTHRMEPEWAEIPAATAGAIARARAEGRRVVAVGTTTTRALESAAARTGEVAASGFWADRFIVPGVRFQVVDALLTNFHLPRSTLLMLVCALAGRERIRAAYAEAVRHRYRFYSYGDAMLIG
jgi:S-adenosylmethionine:tRNA ribosyltransferase-isomerase